MNTNTAKVINLDTAREEKRYIDECKWNVKCQLVQLLRERSVLERQIGTINSRIQEMKEIL